MRHREAMINTTDKFDRFLRNAQIVTIVVACAMLVTCGTMIFYSSPVNAKPALPPVVPIAVCPSGACTILRVYDPKFGVACYINAVPPSAPSCVVAEPLP